MLKTYIKERLEVKTETEIINEILNDNFTKTINKELTPEFRVCLITLVTGDNFLGISERKIEKLDEIKQLKTAREDAICKIEKRIKNIIKDLKC